MIKFKVLISRPSAGLSFNTEFKLGGTPILPKLTKEEYIEELKDEWASGNSGDDSCRCSTLGIHAPCSFCENGFNCTLEEYIEYGLDAWDGIEKENAESDYDRAMEIIK